MEIAKLVHNYSGSYGNPFLAVVAAAEDEFAVCASDSSSSSSTSSDKAIPTMYIRFAPYFNESARPTDEEFNLLINCTFKDIFLRLSKNNFSTK
mgnify:CR=1 FL=1